MTSLQSTPTMKELVDRTTIDINYINSLLSSEPLLCHKTHTLSPNKSNHSPYSVWDPSEIGKSPEQMYIHYIEIVHYKESCIPEIKRRVEEVIQDVFNNIYENNENFKRLGKGDYDLECYFIDFISVPLSGCKRNSNGIIMYNDTNYWKFSYITQYIWTNYIEELKSLQNRCRVLYKKNKDKPSLEEEITKLKERNSLLEKRLETVREAVSINFMRTIPF
jgi:hypothetical protein